MLFLTSKAAKYKNEVYFSGVIDILYSIRYKRGPVRLAGKMQPYPTLIILSKCMIKNQPL